MANSSWCTMHVLCCDVLVCLCVNPNISTEFDFFQNRVWCWLSSWLIRFLFRLASVQSVRHRNRFENVSQNIDSMENSEFKSPSLKSEIANGYKIHYAVLCPFCVATFLCKTNRNGARFIDRKRKQRNSETSERKAFNFCCAVPMCVTHYSRQTRAKKCSVPKWPIQIAKELYAIHSTHKGI